MPDQLMPPPAPERIWTRWWRQYSTDEDVFSRTNRVVLKQLGGGLAALIVGGVIQIGGSSVVTLDLAKLDSAWVLGLLGLSGFLGLPSQSITKRPTPTPALAVGTASTSGSAAAVVPIPAPPGYLPPGPKA